MPSQVVTGQEAAAQREPWGALQWLIGGPSHGELGLTIGRVTFEPGQSNPHHRHPNCDEVLHVIEGRVEHTLADGSVCLLNAGDSIVIPRNVPHHARNTGSGRAEVLVIFNSGQRQVVGE